MSKAPVILWLREDLRFDDNPAMRAAAETGQPVICIYVFDEKTPGEQAMGGAQRWWLHHSLTAFREDLDTREGALILRQGDPKDIIPALAEETGAAAVFWNRRYMKWQTETDAAIKSTLKENDVRVESFNARLLFEPWEVETRAARKGRT